MAAVTPARPRLGSRGASPLPSSLVAKEQIDAEAAGHDAPAEADRGSSKMRRHVATTLTCATSCPRISTSQGTSGPISSRTTTGVASRATSTWAVPLAAAWHGRSRDRITRSWSTVATSGPPPVWPSSASTTYWPGGIWTSTSVTHSSRRPARSALPSDTPRPSSAGAGSQSPDVADPALLSREPADQARPGPGRWRRR